MIAACVQNRNDNYQMLKAGATAGLSAAAANQIGGLSKKLFSNDFQQSAFTATGTAFAYEGVSAAFNQRAFDWRGATINAVTSTAMNPLTDANKTGSALLVQSTRNALLASSTSYALNKRFNAGGVQSSKQVIATAFGSAIVSHFAAIAATAINGKTGNNANTSDPMEDILNKQNGQLGSVEHLQDKFGQTQAEGNINSALIADIISGMDFGANSIISDIDNMLFNLDSRSAAMDAFINAQAGLYADEPASVAANASGKKSSHAVRKANRSPVAGRSQTAFEQGVESGINTLGELYNRAEMPTLVNVREDALNHWAASQNFPMFALANLMPTNAVDIAIEAISLGAGAGVLALGKGVKAAGGASNQQILNVRRISGSEANKSVISDEALAQGWLPPYPNSAGVRSFTTADDLDFVRVHVRENKPQGGFLVREKEIAHLNGDAEKIRVYLGLRDKPAFISDVRVPANTQMQTGRIGAQPNFGLNQTSGFQYQLLDEIPKSSFSNTRVLR